MAILDAPQNNLAEDIDRPLLDISQPLLNEAIKHVILMLRKKIKFPYEFTKNGYPPNTVHMLHSWI